MKRMPIIYTSKKVKQLVALLFLKGVYMTNAEYYRDKLLSMDYQIAVKDGVPVQCKDIECKECELNKDGECTDGKLVRWILAEKE